MWIQGLRMKYLIPFILFITGCAAHQPPARQLDRMFVDCANQQQQEAYLMNLLNRDPNPAITDLNNVLLEIDNRKWEQNIAYKKQIKAMLWEVRSTCGQ